LLHYIRTMTIKQEFSDLRRLLKNARTKRSLRVVKKKAKKAKEDVETSPYTTSKQERLAKKEYKNIMKQLKKKMKKI